MILQSCVFIHKGDVTSGKHNIYRTPLNLVYNSTVGTSSKLSFMLKLHGDVEELAKPLFSVTLQVLHTCT